MGMSTYVEGYRPPDEQWQKMKAIWDACKAADMDPPEEVKEFFDWREPDPKGIKVDIEKPTPEGAAAVPWKGDMEEGIEVELAKLPPNITHIRFINSW